MPFVFVAKCRAKVVGRERSKRGAVTLRFFEDDGSQCWLPVEDVQRWLEDGGNKDGKCTSTASDEYAAEALGLLKGVSSESGPRGIVEQRGALLKLHGGDATAAEKWELQRDQDSSASTDGVQGSVGQCLEQQAIEPASPPFTSTSNLFQGAETASSQKTEIRQKALTTPSATLSGISADLVPKVVDCGPSCDASGTNKGRLWTPRAVIHYLRAKDNSIVKTSADFSMASKHQLEVANLRDVIDLTAPCERPTPSRNARTCFPGTVQLQSFPVASKDLPIPPVLPSVETVFHSTQANPASGALDSFPKDRAQDAQQRGATIPQSFARDGVAKVGDNPSWSDERSKKFEIIYIDVEPPRNHPAPPQDPATNSNSQSGYQQRHSLRGDQLYSNPNWSLRTPAGSQCNTATNSRVQVRHSCRHCPMCNIGPLDTCPTHTAAAVKLVCTQKDSFTGIQANGQDPSIG